MTITNLNKRENHRHDDYITENKECFFFSLTYFFHIYLKYINLNYNINSFIKFVLS